MKLHWHKANVPHRYRTETASHVVTIEQYRNGMGQLESCWYATYQRKADLSLSYNVGIGFDSLRQAKHWIEISLERNEI